MKKLGGLCRQCAVSNCWDLSKFKAALWHRSILGRLVETTMKWAVSFCTSTGVESERRSRTNGNHFDPSDKPFTKKQYWTVFACWLRPFVAEHFAHCDRIWLHLNLDWDPHSSFASCGINKGRLPSFGSMHLAIAMKCYESMIGHKSVSRTHTKKLCWDSEEVAWRSGLTGFEIPDPVKGLWHKKIIKLVIRICIV